MLLLEPPPIPSGTMSFQSAIGAAISRAVKVQGGTRDDLADRLGVARGTLYNATKRPRVIGLEVVEEIAKLAKLSPTESLTLFMAWVRDRAESEELLASFVDYFEALAEEKEPAEWMKEALAVLQRYKKRLGENPRRRRKGTAG
jgi:transcriptional regulator with XRE-family HTH domain